MKSFIENFCKPSEETANKNINFEDLITSDFLTSTLTLNYVIQQFCKQVNNPSMVVHIIGSNRADLLARSAWKLLLYRLKILKSLKIIFIGKDIPEWSETDVDTSNFCQIAVKNLKVESHACRYDKYLLSKQFIKPDIIFGCNLNIHECELDLSDNFWMQTILAVEKVGVPFILTAGTKKRIEKDHSKICDFFDKSVDFTFLEENPFASLSPERDFETEEIMYSNKYIIVYNEKFCLHNSTNEMDKMSEKSYNGKLQLKAKFLKSRVTNFGTIGTEDISTNNNNNIRKQDERLKTVIQRKDVKVEGAVAKNHVNDRNGIGNQMISVSCENLNSRTKTNESFLIKHNSFLKHENERLREQLDLAITEIAKLESKIQELEANSDKR